MPTMTARVLVLSRHEHLGLGLVRALGVAGYRVHAVSDDPAPVFRFSRHCRRFHHADERLWTEAPAGALEELARSTRADVVVAADLDSMKLLARVGHELRGPRVFPVPPLELIELCDDKWAFTQRMAELDVPCPRTRRAETPDELRAIEIDGPLFLKPVFGANSEGVWAVDGPDDVEAYLRTPDVQRWFPLLIQERMPGPDVDISLLRVDGEVRAWTIQSIGDSPTVRVFQEDEAVLEVGTRFVERTGYEGVVHLDLMRDGRGGVRVLEANPRFWITLMHSVWAGVNFAALGVEHLLGGHPPFEPVVGECDRASLSVRKLAREVGAGHLVPPTLPAASRRAWRDLHLDPLPQIVNRLEAALRR
jgi:predicted ATP-grasp superfamily ATP-dependent carboligase